MRSAASVKDRLKNYAQKSGRTFQDVLTVSKRLIAENRKAYEELAE